MARIILAIGAVLIGAAVAAAITGTARWSRSTQAAVDQLASTSPTPVARVLFLHESIGTLPAPVARYLKAAVTDGHPTVRSAVATQEAEFFINGAWRPLAARQHFTTGPPGFVWDARIEMAPLLPASVRDAYVDGRGAMQASMFGLYSLADQVGQPELNAGALQRYLGEAVWFPTALLPSPSVAWRPRDDRSAVVTLRDGDVTVSLTYEFNDRDLVSRITGDRYKEGGGAYSVQPWQIECDEHAGRDGMVIPLRCEVSWIDGGLAQPYWRGRITTITYGYN
jgi:hypothetical protein